jgi:25S rRNA (adenine2142-N1)-methyltransferase
MTAKKARSKKPLSLSHGRPPTIKKTPPSLSSKATRTLINVHHQLHKKLAQAQATGNTAYARELEAQIEANGGLQSYQLASKTGQSAERGGDSSKVLVEWLEPTLRQIRDAGNGHHKDLLRVLEIGALSTKNECSHVEALHVTRIDLHSQEEGILEQDFMQRPLPAKNADRFHIISLSLVLNYMPDTTVRGDMLVRSTEFLTALRPGESSLVNEFKPCLFLVLPLACVSNSRYFTEARLKDIMSSLGYRMTQRKVTTKLVFYLWVLDGVRDNCRSFKKEVLNPGKTRNNFTIILRPTKRDD